MSEATSLSQWLLADIFFPPEVVGEVEILSLAIKFLISPCSSGSGVLWLVAGGSTLFSCFLRNGKLRERREIEKGG